MRRGSIGRRKVTGPGILDEIEACRTCESGGLSARARLPMRERKDISDRRRLVVRLRDGRHRFGCGRTITKLRQVAGLGDIGISASHAFEPRTPTLHLCRGHACLFLHQPHLHLPLSSYRIDASVPIPCPYFGATCHPTSRTG